VVLHPGRQDPWRCGEVIGGGDHVDDLDELRATGLGLDHSSAADLGDLLRAAVRASFAERSTGEIVLGPPKSKAGLRVVGIPKAIRPVLQDHVSRFVGPAPAALVFPGAKGGPLRRGNFNKMAGWPHAVQAIGAEGLHFHDLRHTGNAFAASSGAGLRNLMARMGHDSERSSTSTRHAGPTRL
jgi:integrase